MQKTIPPLAVVAYKEYAKHSMAVRASVLYFFLFSSLSTRELDEKILGIDSIKTKGWRSFEILGALGLNNAHKGLFCDASIQEAIGALRGTSYDCKLIIEHIDFYRINMQSSIIEKDIYEENFLKILRKAQDLGSAGRIKCLEKESVVPEKIRVISTIYKRNANLVAEVLYRANGICARCKRVAPFSRATDDTPYLEVHHIRPLSDGGMDCIENAIALCPNCHRELHYGKND